jgi:alpha-glucosidase (family GH31 glycosyl hydrolase)
MNKSISGRVFRRIALCVVFVMLGCAYAPADVQHFQFQGTGTNTTGKTLSFEVLTDQLFHFEIARTPTSPILTTPLVQKKSYSGATFAHPLTSQGLGFQTAAAQVEVDAETLCMKVFDLKRKVMLTQACPGATPDAENRLTLSREQMQNVYGLGAQFRNLGTVNGDWAGTTRTPGGNYGNSMVAFGGGGVGNVQIPVLYAIGAGHLNYALYLDDVYALSWDFTSDVWSVTHPPVQSRRRSRTRVTEVSEKPFRGYFILGGDLPELRTQYMDLMGHPLVPPKKAFGLWVSEFGYKNWSEIDDKLKTLRKNRFPIDGFVLDLYWYGGYDSTENSAMGLYDWDTANFPHPKEKIASYDKNSGIGLMCIEESYISEAAKNFSLMENQGFLARNVSETGTPMVINNAWWGTGGMIDWSSDAAGAFWHDHMRQPLADMGMTFHWTDLGEPESFQATNWYHGIDGYGSTETDVHNLYNFKWHQSIFDGYQRNHETKRHFILSRSGEAGIQRFGSALWSGDIGSNLRSLSSHLNAQMHMSLSGIDYYGADIGGFHRQALEGDLNELYTRWFAHATWFDVPVRPHTDDGSKQNFTAPDRIGDKASNLYNIRQRYELAPYYYSLAHRAYLFGEPVVPPLVYYFQEDPNVRIVAEEKMVGPSLLVATSAKAGENDRGVYLPQGDWVNYHTNTWYHSTGQWFGDFPEMVDKHFVLPALARAGAIIPMALIDDQSMNILGKRLDGSHRDEMTARVYSSRTFSAFTLYEDDGVSESYKQGRVAQTEITQLEQDHVAQVNFAPTQGTYDGAPENRSFRVEWISENKTVTNVRLDGRNLPECSSLDDLNSMREGWYNGGVRGVFAKSDLLGATARKEFTFFY